MSLSNDEKIRYARHLSLPDFGLESQEKLKHAKVLVVGTGGLGAPLLQYLTAAGVGTIGMVDFDVVDASNLQRQVLFGASDIGEPKTTTAITKLKDQNPHVAFVEHTLKLDSYNALDIIKSYDLVADGTDNFPTRYLVNDASVLTGKPLIYGSIFQHEGQVSVFNYQGGPNYRDLFPTPPPAGMIPSCAEGGVLGVLPGIIGSLQANEVIKVITGNGDTLSGRLFLFDALNVTTRTVNIQKNPNNPLTGDEPSLFELIDYEQFCGTTLPDPMETITVQELKNWREADKDFLLLDVRESYEFDVSNLNCENISLYDLPTKHQDLPKDKPIVLYCKSGARSAKAFKVLRNAGFTNQLSLEGGISAWCAAYDPELIVL